MGDMGGGWSLLGFSTPMGQLSTRNIQALNMIFSSWALVFLSLGIMVDDWVTLNFETKTNMQSHSPWIHTTIWPKGKNYTMERGVGREGSSFLDFCLPDQLTHYSLAQFPQVAVCPLP